MMNKIILLYILLMIFFFLRKTLLLLLLTFFFPNVYLSITERGGKEIKYESKKYSFEIFECLELRFRIVFCFCKTFFSVRGLVYISG